MGQARSTPTGGNRRRSLLAVPILTALICIASPGGATPTRGPTLPELVEVADIESPAPSPDGGKVAFRVQRQSILRNSYSIDWYVADLTSGRSARVGDGGAPIYNDGLVEAEPPVWSPDGRFFYHRALVDGAIGIWRTAADGSGSQLIVSGEADVESLSATPDGLSLVYVTGPSREQIARAEQHEYDDGILVNETVDIAQNPYRGGWVHGRLGSQRLVGRWYSRDGLLWRAPRTRHRLDMRSLAATSEPEPARPVEPLRAAADPAALTATSASGDVAIATGEDYARNLAVRRGDSELFSCPAAACRGAPIVALAWRPGRDEILFTTEDRHFRQSLQVWSPRTGRVRQIAAADGLIGGGRQPHAPCAVTAETLICVVAGAASPPQLESVAFDGGQRTILLDPNAALRARVAPTVEHLSWRLADGRLATGTFFLPSLPAGARAPVFLTYYYCYGYLRGGVGDEFPLLAMVEAGFVVGCLNMVPFGEWGDGVDRYRAAQASVESLIALLDRRGIIDRDRVGMGGFSAGSEAAMWIATNTRLLAAASIASPPYEPSAYWMGAMRGRDNPRVMREFMQAGPPDEDGERWRVIAPALNVSRFSAPLLMQFPVQEVRHAAEFYARLSNTTTPVEMYAFPDEAHVRLQPRHRYAAYRRNLDWFRYWLQNYVDPDPARAEQYQRWDALRRRRDGSAAE